MCHSRLKNIGPLGVVQTMIIQLMESIKLEFRSSLIASLLSPLIQIKTLIQSRLLLSAVLASHNIKMMLDWN